MTYPTLLIQLDDEPYAALRLERLLGLVGPLAGHVTGLSIRRPATGDAAALPGLDALTRELGVEEERASQRARTFNAICDGLQLKSCEVVDATEESRLAIVGLARFSDLVVLQQPDASLPSHREQRSILDHTLLHSVRPTLVIPNAMRFESIGKTALVAWDGSREAARAVADALPLLRRAAEVHIINFDRGDDDAVSFEPGALNPLRTWLMRHGVAAKAATLTARNGIGEALLSHAHDLGADLLVMGAWGHSRLAERLLGGVTRTVIETMTLPVLFSH